MYHRLPCADYGLGYGYEIGSDVALRDGVIERVTVAVGTVVLVRVVVPSGMGYGYCPAWISVGVMVILGVRVVVRVVDVVRVRDGVSVGDGVRERVGERRSAAAYWS